MNNSILGRISEFVKSNNISLDGLYYNFSDFFPKSFYDTVINYLSRAYLKYDNSKPIYDFFIGFDKNNNAYFKFIGKDDKTKVVIIKDGIQYDCDFSPALVIKENIFLENVKNLDHARNYQILNELPIDFLNRFIKDSSQIEPIEKSFDEIATEIIYYINYINKELQMEYELLQNEYEEAKEIEKIYFMEPEQSHNKYGNYTPTPKTQAERKNKEIALKDRIEVLDSYKPISQFEAKSTNSNAIYHVKVFNVKNKCKLIIEPVEGTKYTKVVHINKEKLESAQIKQIVIDTLQLTRDETTKSENITRHSHTTIEEYKKLLEYLLNEKNTGLASSTKRNIDEASGTKKR